MDYNRIMFKMIMSSSLRSMTSQPCAVANHGPIMTMILTTPVNVNTQKFNTQKFSTSPGSSTSQVAMRR